MNDRRIAATVSPPIRPSRSTPATRRISRRAPSEDRAIDLVFSRRSSRTERRRPATEYTGTRTTREPRVPRPSPPRFASRAASAGENGSSSERSDVIESPARFGEIARFELANDSSAASASASSEAYSFSGRNLRGRAAVHAKEDLTKVRAGYDEIATGCVERLLNVHVQRVVVPVVLARGGARLDVVRRARLRKGADRVRRRIEKRPPPVAEPGRDRRGSYACACGAAPPWTRPVARERERRAHHTGPKRYERGRRVVPGRGGEGRREKMAMSSARVPRKRASTDRRIVHVER